MFCEQSVKFLVSADICMFNLALGLRISTGNFGMYTKSFRFFLSLEFNL